MRGVYCGHPRFTNVSEALCDVFGLKPIVLVRHPFDHLVALACHWRRRAEILERYISAGLTPMPTAIGHADPKWLLPHVCVDESVYHLVSRRLNSHRTGGANDGIEDDVRGLRPHEWLGGIPVVRRNK